LSEISEIRKKIQESLEKIDSYIEKIKGERDALAEEMERKMEALRFGQFDREELEKFFEEPYVVIPKRPNEWYVIAPKWINFQIGWLERSTKGYNIFVVNKYVKWFCEIPSALQELFRFKEPLPFKVYDGILLTGKEHQEEAWQR